MAGVVQFREDGRRKLAKTMAVLHWFCILPSFICLLAALYIQISIEDKIFFIENYNGAILPGALVFTGFFGLFTHILSGKVAFANSRVEKRKKWAGFLLPVAIVTFVVFLAELVSGAMCFIHIADLGESFDAGIKVAMAAYKNDVGTKEQMDVLQMSYDCCGSKGYRDWFHLHWIHTDYIPRSKITASRGRHSEYGETFVYDDVPFSCCDPDILRPCIHHHVLDNTLHYQYDHRTRTTLHEIGCTDRLMQFYENSVLMLIGAVVMCLSIIQLFTTIGCRYLQTAIQGALDLDDPEGPSEGYLFTNAKKRTKGMDDTVTTEETSPLLDTTAETQDTTLDNDDRYVGMFSDENETFDVVDEPDYVNVPLFKPGVYDEAYADNSYPPPPPPPPPPPLPPTAGPSAKHDDEHVYHDDEVENYLALRFAKSRDKFQTLPSTPSPPEHDGNDNSASGMDTTNNGEDFLQAGILDHHSDDPIYQNVRNAAARSGRGLSAGSASGSARASISSARASIRSVAGKSSASIRPSFTDIRSSIHNALRRSPRADSDIQMRNGSSAGSISSSRRPPLKGRYAGTTGSRLTEVKSNHGSYMSMNISNSSSAKKLGASSRAPTVYHHPYPSPSSMDSQPYIINMKTYTSPTSPMSPLRRSPAKLPNEPHSPHRSPLKRSPAKSPYKTPNPPLSTPPRLSPERMRRRSDRVIKPYVRSAKYNSQQRTYPPRHKRPTRPDCDGTVHGAFSYTDSSRGLRSPDRKPDTSASTLMPGPYIYNTCLRTKRDSPRKSGSPEKKMSPDKVGFKSGISYGCNHYME